MRNLLARLVCIERKIKSNLCKAVIPLQQSTGLLD